MKPIEPGCLAIIIDAKIKSNVGKCVEVVRQVEREESTERWWWCKGEGIMTVAFGNEGASRESCLLRISDPDVEEQVIEAMEGHA